MSHFSNMLPALRRQIRSQVRDSTETIDGWLSEVKITDVVSQHPSWLEPSTDGPLVQLREDERHETFYGILGTDVDTFEVAPSEAFRGVEFELIGTVQTERLVVTVEFETNDGDKFTRHASYDAGDHGRHQIIPVRISAGESVKRASITINTDTRTRGMTQQLVGKMLEATTGIPQETLPVPTRPTPQRNGGPPILFISIDSLRYDRLTQLKRVIDALGSGVVTPEEPRAQGHATQESHGATFTSLHPGTHGLPHTNTLSADVPTLSEFLAEQGYRCSACVSTVNLDPEFGFGRGFHRYERQEMSWGDRAYDIRTQVDTVRNWMEHDNIASTHNRFYFLHCFDAHYPYLPPFPLDDSMALSHNLAEKLLDVAKDVNTGTLRNDLTLDNIDLTEAQLQQAITYYDASVQHVDNHVARLLQFLDNAEVLSEMFVIIAGDHGEEFLERGTLFHTSLYEENIKPGVVVKPPEGSQMPIPDKIDLIDIYPTIAKLVGEPIPEHCQGISWYNKERSRPRITEQLTDQQYRIAVEKDGLKGIFTWNSDTLTRPLVGKLDTEPTAEYYRTQSQVENPTALDAPSGCEALKKTALSFVTDQRRSSTSERRQVSSVVTDRLDHLGYR